MIFLRPCKFYPESAHALMKRIAEFKQNNASLLDNLMPFDEKKAFLENNVVNVLKGRDHKRRRVLIVNSGKTWDPSKVSADQMFRIFYLIHEAAMLEPVTQVNKFLYKIIREKFNSRSQLHSTIYRARRKLHIRELSTQH